MGFLDWLVSPPHRTLGRREIASLRAVQEPKTDENVLARLNQLETTVERLQLDQADRQLAVLTALEKVMHQLRARERKRERENGDENPVDSVLDVHAMPGGGNSRGNYPSSAELAVRRYRRY